MASSLHTHSAYSLLDGFSMPEENLKRASELGLKALAITEHGEVTSWPYYSELHSKYPDVKLLYGIEAYECSDREVKDPDNKYWHLILIARNELGRQAINRLSTLGHLHGFYFKPRIALSDIAKEDTDNLIVLSACLASRLSREQDYDTCVQLVKEYKAVCKHYFLEIQAHDNAAQAEYNQKIMRLAKDTDTQVVVTNDVHAATKEDLKYQNVFVRIANDRDTASEIYDGCYFMSDTEVHAVLDAQIGSDSVDRCLQATDDVADLCDEISMPWHEPELPKIQIPPQYTSSAAYLRDLVKQGFVRRGCDKFHAEKQQLYKKRVKEELYVIEKKDFCDYFLILVDYISWCRKNGIIVGPGRGSACGSLVCYLIGITELDSIKYDLDFGRFLTIERKDLPDVDVDVSDRAPVVEYLTNKYGEDRVVQVMNIVFTTPVTSIRDAGRILGFPYAEMQKISKGFVQKTWAECLAANSDVAENPRYKELLDYAGRITGRPRGYGIHAGGVIVCRQPYYEYIGISRSTNQLERNRRRYHSLMISNEEVRDTMLTREAREAAIKLKQYCNIYFGCDQCYFAMIDGGCLIGYSVPGNWHLEAEEPSDMERNFAKRMLSEDYDYVNIDYDMDGRHVTVYDSKHPTRGKILSTDSFGCLLDAGNYLLKSIADGKVRRRITKP